MNKNETAVLLMQVVVAYERFDVSDSKVDFWSAALLDMPFNLAKNNLLEFSLRSKFAPTIADIRDGFSAPQHLWNDMDEEERKKWVG